MRSDELALFTFRCIRGDPHMMCPGCDVPIKVDNMNQATQAVKRHLKSHGDANTNVVYSFAFNPDDYPDWNGVENGDTDPAIYDE